MIRVRGESGVAALFAIFLAVAFLAMAGLVIDGGYVLAGSRRLTNHAEQAARIGADSLDPASLRDGGQPRVNPEAAAAAARAYLARVGAGGASVSVLGDTVRVTIRDHKRTTILSAVGITSLPISGSAEARSIDESGP